MNTTRRAAFATLLAIGVVGALPAHAQIFGAGEANEQSNVSEIGPKPSPRTRSSVFLGYIPFATFASGGSYVPGIPAISTPGVQGTVTNLGQLVEGDLTFHFNNPNDRNRPNRAGFGGWYWTKGNGDLYQIYGRVFASEQFGFQAAYLSSTSHIAPGPAYTVFAIYQLNSRSLRCIRQAQAFRR